MRQSFLDQHSRKLLREYSRAENNPVGLFAVHQAADLIRRAAFLNVLENQRIALFIQIALHTGNDLKQMGGKAYAVGEIGGEKHRAVFLPRPLVGPAAHLCRQLSNSLLGRL